MKVRAKDVIEVTAYLCVIILSLAFSTALIVGVYGRVNNCIF
jgi:hypothetical protein